MKANTMTDNEIKNAMLKSLEIFPIKLITIKNVEAPIAMLVKQFNNLFSSDSIVFFNKIRPKMKNTIPAKEQIKIARKAEIICEIKLYNIFYSFY